MLGDLGLATVIDLRTVDEAEQRGQYRERVGAAVFHHLPMLDVLPEARDLEEWTDPAYVGRHYGQMRDDAPGTIAQAFGILAQPESLPAMFHCSAGKDRTGVLAALLLAALGVPDETIVADYALSRDAMDRMLMWLQERATDPETLAPSAPRSAPRNPSRWKCSWPACTTATARSTSTSPRSVSRRRSPRCASRCSSRSAHSLGVASALATKSGNTSSRNAP